MHELDKILLRWATVCRSWHETGGNYPDLVAFIAGWYSGRSGATMPERHGRGPSPVSFAKGWAEGNGALIIEQREEDDT